MARRHIPAVLSVTSAALIIATDAPTFVALLPLVIIAAGYALCAGVLTGFACRIAADEGFADTWHTHRSGVAEDWVGAVMSKRAERRGAA